MDKRPCSICGRWFWPNARVGNRQNACSDPACQAARRKKTQAKWRAANPDYAVGRRLNERQAKRANVVPMHTNMPQVKPPPPLDQLPWDVAEDQFEAQSADFMKEFGRVLLRAGQGWKDQKDQMQAQVLNSS